MCYSIIAAILLLTIALSSSNSFLNNERNVLARFYSDFAQLYRPATLKTFADQEQTIERYQFFFTEQEYSQISEKSLIMLYTNVIERTITYHPMPNFEVNGTRYFYRRDPKQIEPIEIELVDSEDRLFREVQKPTRYFYLSSFDDLEYSNQIPVMPYYEVTFICNSTFPKNTQIQSPPLLSYIDRNFQYASRYLLDLPSFVTGKQFPMYTYADIRNNGEQSFIINELELVDGDVSLNPKSFEYLRTGLLNAGVRLSTYKTDPSSIRPLGKQTSTKYAHQLPIRTSITLPPRSVKSLRFIETNITVEPFFYYSSIFLPVNFNDALLNAYNLTSFNEFIPNGRLLLREQGRFVGQIDLPSLSYGETFTMVFDYDTDVTYHRQVKTVAGDENSDLITYYVEYVFENFKSTYDVRINFIESFSTFKYFQIKNISTSNDRQDFPDLISYDTDLRVSMLVPRQDGRKMISYNLIIYKSQLKVNV